MHPYAALAVGLCLVAALFYLDRESRPAPSIAAWVLFIWVLIIGSRPVTAWLDPSQLSYAEAAAEGSPLDRTLYLTLIVTALLVLFARRFDWLRFAAANKWLVIYFGYLGISVLWSDYTFIAFKRWIKDVGNLVMVLLLVTEANPLASAKALLLRTSYVLVPLSVILVKYFPHIARQYDYWTGQAYFSGVATGKNMLGMTLTAVALAHLWALVEAINEKRNKATTLKIAVHMAMLAIIAWLLDLADCSTALACIVVGAITMLMLRVRRVRMHIGPLTLFAAFAGTLVSIPGVNTAVIEPIVGLLGRDMSFTGRDSIWQTLLQQDINPIIGVGSNSFWMGERAERPIPGIDVLINQAHNAYLEVYLNLGLIGLGLYVTLLVSSMRKIIRDLQHESAGDAESFRFAFLVVTVLYGITEALVRLNMIWFVLLLVVVRAIPTMPGSLPRTQRAPVPSDSQRRVSKRAPLRPR